MICVPERGSVKTKGEFSTQRTIMRRHPFHPNLQCNLIYQHKKCGTHQEPHKSVPWKFFHRTEELYDVTDTYPYKEPNAETNSEQANNIPTNPCSWKYNLRHNSKPKCNDDYR